MGTRKSSPSSKMPRTYLAEYVPRYNRQHKRSGIALFSPAHSKTTHCVSLADHENRGNSVVENSHDFASEAMK